MKDIVPKYQEIMWPTLKVLEQLGGSATNAELVDAAASYMGLTEEVLEVMHNDGPMGAFEYRAAWARTYLKFIGAVDNSERGVWTITKAGRGLPDEKTVLEKVKKARKAKARPGKTNSDMAETQVVEIGGIVSNMPAKDWRGELLKHLKAMSADGFESLCQQLLREAGFSNVKVTGKSGDGGIDGEGVLRVNLLSFHVRFQCKKYADSVSSPAIRDFRGAMVGRAEKGLFITTGRFTREAEKEAIRDGAAPIDLIDGNELCELLKQYSLGVSTKMVEEVTIDEGYFRGF